MFRLLKEGKVLAKLIKAKKWNQRLLGLIVYKNLSDEEIFWIPSCQSVHTFFMTFSLDVVFTNRSFQIVKLFEQVRPGKLLFGGFKSWHVFEMKSGFISKQNLKKGDLLHVET